MHIQFSAAAPFPIHENTDRVRARRRGIHPFSGEDTTTRHTYLAVIAIAVAVLLSTSNAFAAASANLGIRVTAKTFYVGSPGTYHLTITNRGPSTTDDVVTVSDTLPTGLSFASSSGAWACSATGAAVTCTNTSPLGLGSSTLELLVNVDTGAIPRVSNRFTVAYAGDAALTNNSITRTTIVRQPRFPVATFTPTPTLPPGTPVPTHSSGPTATATATHTPIPAVTDLMLTKTVSGIFTVGSNGTYLLTVSNLGPNTTNTGITVVDTLPTGLGFVSGTGSGWSCSAAGQTVTCQTGVGLAPGTNSSVTLTVSIAAAAAPTVTNTATLSYPGDTNAANNTVNRPTTVRGG